jgi:hypothetical protein
MLQIKTNLKHRQPSKLFSDGEINKTARKDFIFITVKVV